MQDDKLISALDESFYLCPEFMTSSLYENIKLRKVGQDSKYREVPKVYIDGKHIMFQGAHDDFALTAHFSQLLLLKKEVSMIYVNKFQKCHHAFH